jgi:hypothetical protein
VSQPISSPSGQKKQGILHRFLPLLQRLVIPKSPYKILEGITRFGSSCFVYGILCPNSQALSTSENSTRPSPFQAWAKQRQTLGLRAAIAATATLSTVPVISFGFGLIPSVFVCMVGSYVWLWQATRNCLPEVCRNIVLYTCYITILCSLSFLSYIVIYCSSNLAIFNGLRWRWPSSSNKG